MQTEKEKCPFCGKYFEVEYIKYPCKLDDKRISYIACPYCGKVVKDKITLLGDEDTKCYVIEEGKDYE